MNFTFCSLQGTELNQGILVSHDCRDWTDACIHMLNKHFGFKICIYTCFMNTSCDLHLIFSCICPPFTCMTIKRINLSMVL